MSEIHDYNELTFIEARKAECERCGLAGIHVDTTAGEIVEDGGTVIVQAPASREWLMVDAAKSGELLCDDCLDEADDRCIHVTNYKITTSADEVSWMEEAESVEQAFAQTVIRARDYFVDPDDVQAAIDAGETVTITVTEPDGTEHVQERKYI